MSSLSVVVIISVNIFEMLYFVVLFIIVIVNIFQNVQKLILFSESYHQPKVYHKRVVFLSHFIALRV